MRLIDDLGVHVTLADYATVANLVGAVDALEARAGQLVPLLEGRTVWMVNSTAQGGGVAELLPTHVALLRELGVDTRWAVMETDSVDFFAFTKRIHNLIHDAPVPHPRDGDRQIYEAVNRANAEALTDLVRDGDVVVIHDPQPLATAGPVKQRRAVRTIWRCHIGLEEHTANTRAAWSFLRPYTDPYDASVFSLAEYVPDFLQSRARVIHPTIDPASHKNRELSLHKMVGILVDAGMVIPHWPVLDPPFPEGASRLQADGSVAPASIPEDIGLLARPIVTQVSRWDRLKGFAPLLEGFAILKHTQATRAFVDDRHVRRVAAARLVLAGPDPASIQDDPEGLAVFEELRQRYRALDPSLQRDVAILTLPMSSRKHNALMVNALQRASDIVVQNSLREGFGLTVAEAMWKRTPLLGSARAAGVRLQVRDGTDGCLVSDPENPGMIAAALHDMLAREDRLEVWGRNAQRRAHGEFLVLGELARWLEILVG